MVEINQPSLTFSGGVDLFVRGDEMDTRWAVERFTKIVLHAALSQGFWTRARVEVRGSIDNLDFKLIATLFGPTDAIRGPVRFDVGDFRFIQIRTSVIEQTPGLASFQGYAFSAAI